MNVGLTDGGCSDMVVRKRQCAISNAVRPLAFSALMRSGSWASTIRADFTSPFRMNYSCGYLVRTERMGGKGGAPEFVGRGKAGLLQSGLACCLAS